MNNYKPISNVPFLSKIIEKAVNQQLNNYLLLSNEYIYISLLLSDAHAHLMTSFTGSASLLSI
jgi:hypothetical protein